MSAKDSQASGAARSQVRGVFLLHFKEHWQFLAGYGPYRRSGYPSLMPRGAEIETYAESAFFAGFFGVRESAFSNYKNGLHAVPRELERAIALRYGFGPDAAFVEKHAALGPLELWDAWFAEKFTGWREGDPAAFRAAIQEGLARGEINPLAASDPGLRQAIDQTRAFYSTRGRPAKSAIPGVVGPQRVGGPSEAIWSAEWNAHEVEPWARGLLSRRVRIVYVYGALRSGKSVLIRGLVDRLARETGDLTLVTVDVRDLITCFRVAHESRAVHQLILNRVLHQLEPEAPAWKLPQPYDFDDEMVRVLRRAPAGPIYLSIDSGDACLRIDDADLRDAAVRATAPLFDFMCPIADESAKPLHRRVSLIVEGSRPLRDLARVYDTSPIGKGKTFILNRLDRASVDKLGVLAGLSDTDNRHLYDKTGGHRSLIWAILGSVGEGPNAMAAEPASLDAVVEVLDVLVAELYRQPTLAAALAKALAGEDPDFDSRTRLLHAQYLGRQQPSSCLCPLLEAALGKVPR